MKIYLFVILLILSSFQFISAKDVRDSKTISSRSSNRSSVIGKSQTSTKPSIRSSYIPKASKSASEVPRPSYSSSARVTPKPSYKMSERISSKVTPRSSYRVSERISPISTPRESTNIYSREPKTERNPITNRTSILSREIEVRKSNTSIGIVNISKPVFASKPVVYKSPHKIVYNPYYYSHLYHNPKYVYTNYFWMSHDNWYFDFYIPIYSPYVYTSYIYNLDYYESYYYSTYEIYPYDFTWRFNFNWQF